MCWLFFVAQVLCVRIRRVDPLDIRRCCDVESTYLMLNQRRNNVVYLVGVDLVHVIGLDLRSGSGDLIE